MAPKGKPSKRAASAGAAGGPKAKAARGGVVDYVEEYGCPRDAYASVLEGLAMAEHLNEDCRSMLAVMVPTSLCVPVPERTEAQVMVVGMLHETFREVGARLQAAVNGADEVVAAANTAKAQEDDKVKEAEASLAAAQEVVDEKKAILSEATKAIAAAKTALVENQKEQKSGDAQIAEAKAELEALEETVSTAFKALMEGDWEKPQQAKKLYSPIAALIKKLAVEESMTAALPGALQKKPGERGSFDTVLLQQCQQRFQDEAAALRSRIAAVAAGEGERVAAMAAGQAAAASADEAKVAATDALGEVQAAHKLAVDALMAAKEAHSSSEAALRSACSARDAAQAALETFTRKTLGSFTMLRDRNLKEAAAE